MSTGNEEVEKIMSGLRYSIKDGTNYQNKPHYNLIYEALWQLINENKCLKTNIRALLEEYKEVRNIDLLINELRKLSKK